MKRILSLMVAVMLTTLTACSGQTQKLVANTPHLSQSAQPGGNYV